MTGTVTFIGAGPGAPGLLTLDGAEALGRAGLVLYADSLVSPELARFARPGVPFEGTKERGLDEIVALMIDAARAGREVARLHSGDPALYGAITEQLARLRAAGIPFQIIPGVSSVFAAAAALGVELTVPGVSQSVILTRVAGRTGMPAGEELRSFARHGATMAILLGITRIRQLVADLLAGGYPPDTPAAALYRVSWPDQAVVRGTLDTLVASVKAARWDRQALVLVGGALNPAPAAGAHESHLYDPGYTHRFRRASSAESRATTYDTGALGVAGAVAPAASVGAVDRGAPEPHPADGGLAIVALTVRGAALACRLASLTGGAAHLPARFAPPGATSYDTPVADLIATLWPRQRRLLLVMPVGVAVRSIALLLGDKATDPGVVALDELGRFAVSVVGGHRGGANALARDVARLLGGEAVVTTASDARELPALDLLGRDEGWVVANPAALTPVMAALVNDGRVGVFQEAGSRAWLSTPETATLHFVATLDELAAPSFDAGVAITPRRADGLPSSLSERCVIYHPPCLSVGIGCARGVSASEVATAVAGALAGAGLAPAAVREFASIDLKQDEEGLLAYAAELQAPLRFFTAGRLNEVTAPNPSEVVRQAVGAHGVAEPAALLAAGAESLVVEKQVRGRVTVAVALAPWREAPRA